MNKEQQRILELAKEVSQTEGMSKNVKRAADMVLKSGDPEWNYEFALNVKGADIAEHEKVIINSGDQKYINLLKSHILIEDNEQKQ